MMLHHHFFLLFLASLAAFVAAGDDSGVPIQPNLDNPEITLDHPAFVKYMGEEAYFGNVSSVYANDIREFNSHIRAVSDRTTTYLNRVQQRQSHTPAQIQTFVTHAETFIAEIGTWSDKIRELDNLLTSSMLPSLTRIDNMTRFGPWFRRNRRHGLPSLFGLEFCRFAHEFYKLQRQGYMAVARNLNLQVRRISEKQQALRDCLQVLKAEGMDVNHIFPEVVREWAKIVDGL